MSNVIPPNDLCQPSVVKLGNAMNDRIGVVVRKDDNTNTVGVVGRTLISCPMQTVSSGVDTLHITFNIDNKNGNLLARMKEAKLSLQSSESSESVFRFLENGSDVFAWNIQRIGTKLYPYVFRSGDLILCFSSRRRDSQIPAMSLMIGSISSHQNPLGLLKDLKFWLGCLDVVVVSNKLSRIDLCLDIIHDIKKGRLDKINHYITRARDTQVSYSSRKFTGLQWGRGDVVCRIYDKQLEMRQKQNHEKILYFNYLWNTSQETSVTRVEFQLRRSALREFFKQEVTAEVGVTRSGDLWEYLVNDWLRHSVKPVVKNNEIRSNLSIFWQAVQVGFKKQRFQVQRNRLQKHINIPALRKQAAGIMLTVLAGLGHSWKNLSNMVGTAQEIIVKDLLASFEDVNFADKFVSKQVRAVVAF